MQKGFTLIELIIYLAIVTGVLILAAGFVWNVIQGGTKSFAYEEVQQNGRFSMEKIVRAIKDASDINSPAVGATSTSLSLLMSDASNTVFDLSGTTLRITEGASGPYELTSDLVKVTNLVFSNLSYSGAPGTVRIEMTIEYNNVSGLSEYEASVDLKDTASLRY